jgi:hypothetical protein
MLFVFLQDHEESAKAAHADPNRSSCSGILGLFRTEGTLRSASFHFLFDLELEITMIAVDFLLKILVLG